MQKQEIMVAFSDVGRHALGNIWRITAKNTDFYLDPVGELSVVHLSVHGLNNRHPDGHRFHVKVDRKGTATAEEQGHFLLHSIPRKGHPINGHEVASHAFRVARIRWLWDLQRPRFHGAALSGSVPEISDHQSGALLSKQLQPNDAWDVDLVVSYGHPYWPNRQGSLRDNARLGPLRNDSGMWLTATSYRRSQLKQPAPHGLIPRLPRVGEVPNRILCGGPDDGDNMFWFVEALTSRQVLDDARPAPRR